MEAKRLYIRGLSGAVTEADLLSRFKGFGQVNDVKVATDGFSGDCRGFAHLTLQCDESGWKKCLSTLNGSSWRGQKLMIQEAKADFTQRLDAERQAPPAAAEKPKKRLVRHAANMALVDDKNVEGRKGWRRGKFGRPIAIVRLRKPDGTLVVHDPSHDPNALDRFYEGYHPRPARKLTWFSAIETASGDGRMDEDPSEPETVPEMEQSTLPVPIAPTTTVATAGSTSWENIANDTGFSLAALLNLPSVPIVAKPVITAGESVVEDAVRPIESFDMRKMFYQFDFTSDMPLFYCTGSKLESVSLWKASRSEIRKDFKKQAKAAKRQVRKKQMLSRPSSNR